MRNIDEMIDFFLYEKGETIEINGVAQIALIIDAVEKLNYYDDKIIRTKVEIKTGDIVEYNNLKYLIISQIDKEENSYRSRIRKCSYKMAFNFAGNIKQVRPPCLYIYKFIIYINFGTVPYFSKLKNYIAGILSINNKFFKVCCES